MVRKPLARALGKCLTSACALALATAGPVLAQAQAPVPSLSLELNALQPSDKGCMLTFVVTNDLGAVLDKAAFEMAMFDAAGQVSRLTILDFRDLIEGKTKVLRFDLPGSECAKISRVLINDATECAGAGIDPKACIRALKTSTKAGIAFGF